MKSKIKNLVHRSASILWVSACLFSLATPAHATLTGSTINGSTSGANGINWVPASVMVGPDVEFTVVFTNVTISVDLTDDQVTLSYENTSNFPNITLTNDSFTFTDLVWQGTPGSVIGLTELSNNFPGAVGFETSFGPDWIQIDVPTTNTNPDDLFSATYRIDTNHDGPNHAIPEPFTAMLGLMSLGVLGMATRRRAA